MRTTQNDTQKFDRCLIFAHRGASAEALENTRPAFDKALNDAIDGIETDVQLSRDGVAVLWHDRFLDKMGLAEKRIDDFDYEQLKQLHFPQTGNEDIMTLQAFLAAYRQRCRLLIEVKNRDWEPVSRHEQKMQQTLDLIGPIIDDRIMVSSFNLPSLIFAHQYAAQLPFVYNLDDHHTLSDIRRVLTDCPFLYGFCLPIAVLDQAIVTLLRTHDKQIAVYTCNSDAQIHKALQFEVDIVISDVPNKALNMRENMRQRI